MYSKAKNVSVPVEIDEHRIDADAAFVIRRLRRSGFEAYLVGGSVRDLLLQRQPKDFDVATSASPEEIKQIFRRCRLIGRRFRLAHIMGQKGRIVETATFREVYFHLPEVQNCLITRYLIQIQGTLRFSELIRDAAHELFDKNMAV